MNTSESAAALEAELRVVEEDLARLRETAADLRRRIGEREDEPTDPAERSALIEQAEEQEALIDMLNARREGLLRDRHRAGRPPSVSGTAGVGCRSSTAKYRNPSWKRNWKPARPGKSSPTRTGSGGAQPGSPGIEVTDEQAQMCLQAGPKSGSMPSRSSMPCPITAASSRRHDCTGAIPARDGRWRRKRMKRLGPLSGPAHRSCRAGEPWRPRCRRAYCVPPVPPRRVPRIGAPA
jgi:hypothetical protein